MKKRLQNIILPLTLLIIPAFSFAQNKASEKNPLTREEFHSDPAHATFTVRKTAYLL